MAAQSLGFEYENQMASKQLETIAAQIRGTQTTLSLSIDASKHVPGFPGKGVDRGIRIDALLLQR